MPAWCLVGPIVGEWGAVARGAVVIQDDRIAQVVPTPPPDLPCVDCGDDLIAPGLIDLQLNGAFGDDFTLDPARVTRVAVGLPRYGVTGFLPTLITSPLETYPERLGVIADAMRRQATVTPSVGGARILGVHIEGPFISRGKRGAHNPVHLRLPSVAAVQPMLDAGNVRLLTLAPELPGAPDVIRWLHEQGVVVSVGHTEADYETTRAAIDAGAGWGTHLFNAMPTLGHRAPGPIGAFLEAETPPVGFIVDGIHVHPAVVRLVWRAKGGRGICLVSDAMAALGMPPGRYRIGDQDVYVDEVSARLADGTLAGSILSLDQAVRHMVHWTGCTPGQAAWMASGVPAGVLGLADRGRIGPGCAADLVVFDRELRVRRTVIAGETVFEAAKQER